MTWQGLSDEEIWSSDAIMAANSGYGASFDTLRELSKAIEAKLREKNDKPAEPHLPSRLCMCNDCKPSFEDGKETVAPVFFVRPQDLANNELDTMLASKIRPFSDWVAAYTTPTNKKIVLESAKKVITELWSIIDDIDTYSDIAKSDDAAYRRLVEKRQADRWKTGITTDGYVLKIDAAIGDKG